MRRYRAAYACAISLTLKGRTLSSTKTSARRVLTREAYASTRRAGERWRYRPTATSEGALRSSTSGLNLTRTGAGSLTAHLSGSAVTATWAISDRSQTPMVGCGSKFRDLDQTVIGNPAHDLVRLALSLASAARGSDLPGVTTAYMLEAIIDGYESALEHDFDEAKDDPEPPDAVRLVMKRAAKRTWKELARERIGDTWAKIPLGKRFWPVSDEELRELDSIFKDQSIIRLVTMVKSRNDDASVELIDSAYWMKGCSSLGLLRYAVLLEVEDKENDSSELCLMDVKEAVESAAPSSSIQMPENHASELSRVPCTSRPFWVHE